LFVIAAICLSYEDTFVAFCFLRERRRDEQ